MGVMMRAMDWAATPLGPVQSWPQSLRTTLSIMLAARYPMYVAWGPELIQFYNDAYRPILGANKHPAALGQRTPECLPEIWDFIGPMFRRVMEKGEAVGRADQLLALARSGFVEECYFNFSYSPIRDESGGVGGVFVTCNEVTTRIISERRMRTLRDLAAQMTGKSTVQEVSDVALRVLADNPHDLPFALFYLAGDDDGLRRSGPAGCVPTDELFPLRLGLGGDPAWPAAASQEAALVVTQELADDAVTLQNAVWPEPVTQAAALPIPQPDASRPAGLLVAGVSPRLRFDESYEQFLKLVASQIGEAMAAASAKEEEHRRVEALAELDRAKTVFFSNVSHEFRTPMTLMLGPLEDLLQRSNAELPPTVRGHVELAHRNCRRLLRLVNSLLEFSRIEAGRMRAAYRPTDLAAYTAELAGLFRSAMERGGLRLVVDCPALPEPVFVDREMWERIVLNLLSNAFKFTLYGQVAVSLRVEDGRAVLAVADTGAGISEEEQAHLFERFHRAKGTRGRSFEGTGIGLALVQEMVRLHGGTVEVRSQIEKGSTFVVSLPLGSDHLPADQVVDAGEFQVTTGLANDYVDEAMSWVSAGTDKSSAELIPGEARPVAPAGGNGDGARPCLLVVDDNADVRDYLGRILGETHEVRQAEDGLTAWEQIQKHPPDLVLSDVMMPRLDGFGLLQMLRDDPTTRTVPVILLSARAGEESRVEGLEAGADDYLIKPFSARELLARVESQLKLARLRRDAEIQQRALNGEVRQAKERIEALLASISDGFVAFDQEWRYTYVNQRGVELLGRPSAELLGRCIWEVFPETMGSVMHVEFLRAMREQVIARFDYFYPPWQSWVEMRVYPSREGVSVFFLDVTERKAAAEDSRRMNEGLEISVQQRSAELAAVNERLKAEVRERQRSESTVKQLMQISRSLNSTLDIDSLLNLIVREAIVLTGAESGCAGLRGSEGMICQHYLQKGKVLPLDYCFPPGHGLPGWLILNKVPYLTNDADNDPQILHTLCAQFGVRSALSTPILDRQGEVIGFFEIHNKNDPDGFTAEDQDRLMAVSQSAALAVQNALAYRRIHDAESALRESEARLQAMMDNSPAVIFLKDPEGRYLHMNRRFESEFGLSRHTALGRTDLEIFPREQAEAFRANDAAVMEAGVPLQFEETARYADGEHVSIVSKFPLRDEAGKIYGVCGIATDITERRLFEEGLRVVAETVSADSGDKCLQALVRALGQVLQMDFAFIGELADGKFERARTVAMWGDGAFQPPMEYELANTPCDEVVRQRLCCFPDHVCDTFPKDEWLRERQLCSYVGSPLCDAEGRVIGLISVMGRKPLGNIHLADSMLRIFATRAAGEIERMRAQEELDHYARRLRALSSRLLAAQETERHRISRELHDQVGQSLTLLQLELESTRERCESTAVAGELSAHTDRVGQIIDEVRDLSLDLRPSMLDDLGLIPALRWFADRVANSGKIKIKLDVAADPGRFPAELETVCFRVAQEALTNVLRHARARAVEITLRREGNTLLLVLHDDGCDFDWQRARLQATQGGSLGLLTMEERINLAGGRLTVESVPGNGTKLRVELPLPSGRKQDESNAARPTAIEDSPLERSSITSP
jgi:PAS domain S-box-containing protein